MFIYSVQYSTVQARTLDHWTVSSCPAGATANVFVSTGKNNAKCFVDLCDIRHLLGISVPSFERWSKVEVRNHHELS